MVCILNHDLCVFTSFVIPQVDDCDYSSYRSSDITIHRQAFHRAVCTICNYVPGKDNYGQVTLIYLSLFSLLYRQRKDPRRPQVWGLSGEEIPRGFEQHSTVHVPRVSLHGQDQWELETTQVWMEGWFDAVCTITDGSTYLYQTEQNPQWSAEMNPSQHAIILQE